MDEESGRAGHFGRVSVITGSAVPPGPLAQPPKRPWVRVRITWHSPVGCSGHGSHPCPRCCSPAPWTGHFPGQVPPCWLLPGTEMGWKCRLARTVSSQSPRDCRAVGRAPRFLQVGRAAPMFATDGSDLRVGVGGVEERASPGHSQALAWPSPRACSRGHVASQTPPPPQHSPEKLSVLLMCFPSPPAEHRHYKLQQQLE